MRQLFYRVVKASVWRDADQYRWEAWLLIQGQGTPVRGTISSMEQLETSMHSAIAVAYQKITGRPLPNPDGQLPLL